MDIRVYTPIYRTAYKAVRSRPIRNLSVKTKSKIRLKTVAGVGFIYLFVDADVFVLLYGFLLSTFG